MAEKKECEQCHAEKAIELFRKVTNQYTGVHPMSICKDCYKSNQEEWKRRQAEEWEARKASRETHRRQAEMGQKWEQERIERERARQVQEQEQQAKSREASLAANRLCPRCKQVRTDGRLWPNGHLYFTRYCEACQEYTPHSIYTLTCPLLGIVRYVGITMQSLNKRLQGHVRGDSGTECKNNWIETLKQRGLKPAIALVGEAPNERQAQLEEARYIYHYIQQGFPLVNHEALSPQLVLDLQSSSIDWRHATDDDIRQVYMGSNGDSQEYREMIRSSASAFRYTLREKRRLYILQWHHRHEHVYVVDNRVSFYAQSYEELRAYKHLTTAGSLSQHFAERQAILDTITLAVYYWQTTSAVSQSVSEDLAYLFSKHIPIICARYDDNAYQQQERGIVIDLQRKGKRRLPVIHSFSYTVDPTRSLVNI